MNKLIIIGGLGQFSAYLNTTREEAINLYCESRNKDMVTMKNKYPSDEYFQKQELLTPDNIETKVRIGELEFNNLFYVYDAWV